jgi:hypothetical protein
LYDGVFHVLTDGYVLVEVHIVLLCSVVDG